MVEIVKNGNSVLLKTPSSQDGVGSVITAVSGHLKQHGISDHSVSRAIIVLRELLVNAIKHGNRHNAAYPVNIGIYKLEQNQVKIFVKDYGRGFDTNL
jgi:anti-sigma regulatory factor (Ser/Thr protein kinase)